MKEPETNRSNVFWGRAVTGLMFLTLAVFPYLNSGETIFDFLFELVQRSD